jgi:glycosyltransferase involved in cell wall biosynthesis
MRIKKLKILFFIDSFHIGGMHKQILYLISHINKELFEPIVCTQIPIGGLREEYEKVGCELIDLGWEKKFDLSTVYKLIRVLNLSKPDIIFISQAQNFIYYKFARIFWHRKIVLIGSFRAMTFWNGHLSRRSRYLDIFISRWLYRSSDKVIVNSEIMNEHYSSLINVHKNKLIETIYNGCDFNFGITKDIDSIKNELTIKQDEFLVIMVARLDPWKDFLTLFHSAEIVVKTNSKVKFVLLGDGLIRYDLEKLVLKMGLTQNVFIVGEKKDIFNYINAADISVLSTHGEGFSNTILESMALAIPVIATNAGGNKELLGINNEYGNLIPPNSPHLFADAILNLINSEDKRKKNGQSAQQRIFELCNIDKYTSSYENLFLRMMKNKN